MIKSVLPSVYISGLSLALLITACSIATPTPTAVPTIEPTATIAPTVPGPTYTPTPLPTETPTPTPTIVVTDTPTITNTPEVVETIAGEPGQPTSTGTPGGRPQIIPIQDTNCHVKPKQESNVVGFFLKGMIFDVYGKDSTGVWVIIPNPQEDGQFCWVWTGSTQITGSLDNVPVNP
jgi:hypothetical protein